MRYLKILPIAVLVAGCAYNAAPAVAPASNVVTSFSQKVSGRWLLRTEAARLAENVRPSDLNCAAHTFPLDFAGSFPGSVRGTLQNVIERLEDAPEGLTADRVRASGARGIIDVRGESLRGQLRVVPGFWSANITTEVEISAAVTVDGPQGRLFGKTVDGRGRGEAPAGVFCSGGAVALSAAANDAQRDLLRRIGEEIGNAERLRAAR